MAHLDYTTENRKGKQLNYEKRIKIEALSKVGLKTEAIAKQIGCSGRTIRRELAKGRTELLNSDYTTRIEYSADIGEFSHERTSERKTRKSRCDRNTDVLSNSVYDAYYRYVLRIGPAACRGCSWQ